MSEATGTGCYMTMLRAVAVLGLAAQVACGVGNEAEARAVQPLAQAQAGLLGSSAIDLQSPGVPIPKSFLGLAHEWIPFAWTQGSTQQGVDPVYLQLLRNLFEAADGPLNFRVGGNTQDTLHGPAPQNMLQQVAAVQQAMKAQVVVGIDMKSDDANLSLAQLQAALKVLPAGILTTVELGNEPDNYPLDFGDFLARFDAIGGVLTRAQPTLLGGPSYSGLIGVDDFNQFIKAQRPRLNLLELHGYTGWAGNGAIDLTYLLDEAQSAGWAATYGQYVAPAHAAGLPVRISEMNSLWGFGKAGVSNTFGAALWATDVLFELMRVGLDGVNFTGSSTQIYAAIHDYPDPNAQGMLSRIGAPYYGFLLFTRATAHGGTLLQTQQSGENHVKVWATQDPNKAVRVAILNKDDKQQGLYTVSGLPSGKTATIDYLLAPSMAATSGISFAGQSYEDSPTGLPAGTVSHVIITDDGQGNYVLPLGAHEAALLSIQLE